MNRLIILILITVTAAGCSRLRLIERQYIERVDTVRVPVELPGHALDAEFQLADSVLIEDEKIGIRLTRLPDLMPLPVPEDAAAAPGHMPPVPDSAAAAPLRAGHAAAYAPAVPHVPGRAPMPRYRIEAEIKPDTVFVPVEQKTITETETRTVTETKMPFLGWVGIGFLVALVLVLAVRGRF